MHSDKQKIMKKYLNFNFRLNAINTMKRKTLLKFRHNEE